MAFNFRQYEFYRVCTGLIPKFFLNKLFMCCHVNSCPKRERQGKKNMHIVFRSLGRRAKLQVAHIAGHAVAWASCPLMRASLSVRIVPACPSDALEDLCFSLCPRQARAKLHPVACCLTRYAPCLEVNSPLPSGACMDRHREEKGGGQKEVRIHRHCTHQPTSSPLPESTVAIPGKRKVVFPAPTGAVVRLPAWLVQFKLLQHGWGKNPRFRFCPVQGSRELGICLGIWGRTCPPGRRNPKSPSPVPKPMSKKRGPQNRQDIDPSCIAAPLQRGLSASHGSSPVLARRQIGPCLSPRPCFFLLLSTPYFRGDT